MYHRTYSNGELCSRGSLWIGNDSVNLYSEESDAISYRDKLQDTSRLGIPGWKFSDSPSDSQYSIVYLQSEIPSLGFDFETKSLTARGRPEDFENGQVLAYLAFWLTEPQRQAKSAYTMYSAALAIEGNGALLLGPSGAGKTSVLLKLCQICSCEVVSNNLTLVRYNSGDKHLYLEDGTKEIRPRFAAANDFPELKRRFSQTDELTWETKVSITPEEIGARRAEGPKKLTKIFETHYDIRGQDGFVARREDGLDVRYRLYENMSRVLRGTAISVFDKDNRFLGYMPSLDTPDLHSRRVQCIEAMVNEVGVISISGGNLLELAEAVHSITVNKDGPFP